ncbi:fibronectin type III domain-containing protein [Paludisphaera rhizosphaerae]|uniref:fibronectin type III domain-containing protein n=1 Tax=Paludisphaera rhizosphaerae TaxID=2711216 RepID=UPI0013EC8353|nr:fibronectin type III domain-containing protein [Paludisphaera rhizosphaerae]
MAVTYNVYGNDGAGGPVDYSTPVATVSATTWSTSALAAPGLHRFAVRAVDGEEESNVDAVAAIPLSAAGVDLSGLPSAPIQLAAAPAGGGTIRVAWRPASTGPFATSYRVYVGTGGTPSYTTPVATVSPRGSGLQAATLTGLTAGTAYAVAVRAANAAGEESNTTIVEATLAAAPPSAPASLTATAV